MINRAKTFIYNIAILLAAVAMGFVSVWYTNNDDTTYINIIEKNILPAFIALLGIYAALYQILHTKIQEQKPKVEEAKKEVEDEEKRVNSFKRMGLFTNPNDRFYNPNTAKEFLETERNMKNYGVYLSKLAKSLVFSEKIFKHYLVREIILIVLFIAGQIAKDVMLANECSLQLIMITDVVIHSLMIYAIIFFLYVIWLGRTCLLELK